MIKEWAIQKRRQLGDYAIFKMRQDTSRSPRTGRDHMFIVLDAPDWVNVLPVTSAGQVVLIKQYRHGTETITVEIPGGMVDPEDGDPAQGAQRELLEETGYAADEFVLIGSVAPNPAFLDNRCYTYLATNARRVQEPQFDGSEDIAVMEVPLADIPDMIGDGRITHALVVAGFYHLDHYYRRQQVGE